MTRFDPSYRLTYQKYSWYSCLCLGVKVMSIFTYGHAQAGVRVSGWGSFKLLYHQYFEMFCHPNSNTCPHMISSQLRHYFKQQGVRRVEIEDNPCLYLETSPEWKTPLWGKCKSSVKCWTRTFCMVVQRSQAWVLCTNLFVWSHRVIISWGMPDIQSRVSRIYHRRSVMAD